MTARHDEKAGDGPAASAANRRFAPLRELGSNYAAPVANAGAADFRPTGASLARTLVRHMRANIADMVAERPGVGELVAGIAAMLLEAETAPLTWLHQQRRGRAEV